MHVFARRSGKRFVVQVGGEIAVIQIVSAEHNTAKIGVIAQEGTTVYMEETARQIGLEEKINRLMDEDCGYSTPEPYMQPPVPR